MGDNDHRTGSKRIPRKVLHFSDGIVEEYSTDDEEEEVTEYKKRQAIDPVKRKKITFSFKICPY